MIDTAASGHVPQPRSGQTCTPTQPCRSDHCTFCDNGGYLASRDAASQLLDSRYPTADPVPDSWVTRNLADTRQTGDLGTEHPFLDWGDLLSRDFANVEFLAGDLLCAGGHSALVGEGKAGKSLLALDWAQAISTGRPIFGARARKPYRVLYVDFENAWNDLQQRVAAFGFTAADLAEVKYLSFPPMPPLNTGEGADFLMRHIRSCGARVVIFDTISRMIEGKENDSDPWLSLYRKTTLRLKAEQVASIRLDHFGKDAAKGARGSSAKEHDVDAIWELSAGGKVAKAGMPVSLRRTHTRNGLGQVRLDLWRTGRVVKRDDTQFWAPGETGHVLRESGGEEEPFLVAEHLADLADEVGVLKSAGRDTLRAALPDQKHAKAVWEQAAKIRKGR